MKHYAKPVVMQAPSPKPEEVPISEISIDSLIDDGLLALHREIKNIVKQGVHGKLDAPTARDLRDHLKLLFEIRDRELEGAKGLTNEQIQEIIEKLNAAK